MKLNSGITSIFLLLLSLSAGANEPNNPPIDKAMKIITNTSTEICGQPQLSGASTTISADGSMSAKLSGLVKKLANAGFSLSTEYSTETHQGVLKDQIIEAIKSTQSCKIEVLKIITERLLVPYDNKNAEPTQIISNSSNSNNLSNISNSPITIKGH